MKKTTIITASLTIALMLSSCGVGPAPAAPEAPVNAPVKSGTVVEETPAPVVQLVSDGTSKVSAKFNETFEQYFAPDVSDMRILSFSYLTPVVRIDNNDAAADKINEALALSNEFFYSGNDKYPGVSAYHEMALDTYSYATENGLDINYEMYAARKASATRCDNNAVSARFTVSSFTGQTEEFYIEGMNFDTKSGQQLALNNVISDMKAFEKIFSESCTSWQESSGSGLLLGSTIYNNGTDAMAFLNGCQWYMTGEGIVIVIDSPDVRAKVFSPIELLIPYSSLNGCLKKAYEPEVIETNSTLYIKELSNGETVNVEITDRIVCSDYGKELLLATEGRVADVSIYRVVYSGNTFYKTDAVWAANAISTSGIQLSADISVGIPGIMVCCKNADGTVSERIVTMNDGAVVLADNIEVLG